jgi:hypothetical protein
MALDKELYQRVYELHRQWHEADLKERLRKDKKRSPGEGWRQYIELWKFARNADLKPNQHQSLKRMIDWEEYYSRVRQLEAWRRERGR